MENNEQEKSIAIEFKVNKTTGTYSMAKYLTEKYDIITIGEFEREVYVYENGIYRRAENEILFPEIQRILGDQVNKNAKSETMHKIQDMTSKPRAIFESADPRYIPLKNGVYDFKDKILLPHDSKYRFKHQFPINYIPNADCQKTKEFLQGILTEEQLLTIQEWMGYYFYRLYAFKKALICVGEGDTGKTTMLEVIMHLIGQDNISSISLQKMSGDKFSAAHLYGKHANIVDELSAKDISDTGAFKIATGNGSITGEYKYGNQFSFKNYSKFTFACNKIPDVKDMDDDAYFNRWIVIRFEKTIANKIPNFIDRLATDEERSGLFNFAMEGLERLLENGRFTYNKDAIDTKQEMLKSGSSISMFAADGIQQQNGEEITKENLYEAYCEFCAERGLGTETIKMFGSKLPSIVDYIVEGWSQSVIGNKRKSVRVWRNVIAKKDKSIENIPPGEPDEYDLFMAGSETESSSLE